MPIKPGFIIRTILIFAVVYVPVLVSWIVLKQYYTWPVACSGAGLAAMTLDADIDACTKVGQGIKVLFTRYLVTPAGVFPAHSGIIIDDNQYTFNVPISLAMLIVTAMILRITWSAWTKALAALVIGHLMYVYACVLNQLQSYRIPAATKEIVSSPSIAIQLFWDFCHTMLIRFEPFLILSVLIFFHLANTAKRRNGTGQKRQ